MRPAIVTVSVATALLVLTAATLPAQSSDRHVYAKRATLEAQAAEAEARTAATTDPEARNSLQAEAYQLRHRLRAGDFLVGDRIVIEVIGEPELTDTAVVRTGTAVQIGKLPSISLDGVLRSEVEEHLTREIGRYVRGPRVTAVPLLRVAVFGNVLRPGYVHVPADMQLSDLLMRAGGPSGTADLRRAELRRDGERLIGAKSVQTALSGGMSLDALNLRSGDEFNVPQKRSTNWSTTMQTALALTSLLSVAFTLSR